MLNDIQKKILAEVADLHKVPEGAYNIRTDGESAGRNSTANIQITSKTDKPGIDIRIKDGTVNESVHIPLLSVKADSRKRFTTTFSLARIAM